MTPALQAALADLEAAARRGRRPDAYLARSLLLALGAALRTGDEAELAARVRGATAPLEPAWTRAVQDELTLAIGEFAQCVDPRFLDHPDYDVEYTRAARERLEDRLGACRALAIAVPCRDSEVLVLADRVFATSGEKRSHGAGRARQSGPAGPPASRS